MNVSKKGLLFYKTILIKVKSNYFTRRKRIIVNMPVQMPSKKQIILSDIRLTNFAEQFNNNSLNLGL